MQQEAPTSHITDDGELRATVHQGLKWVTPDQLKSFEFCPADVGIVSQLQMSKSSLPFENK